MKQETVVVIVGAGPAGIATSACLNRLSIPNVVVEREDCYASLWQKKTYDHLKLRLAKNVCGLPHMPFPTSAPTFVPKNMFVQYLHDYVYKFNVCPLYQRSVESASYNTTSRKWIVIATNRVSGLVEEYVAKFLVVATGENSQGCIPSVSGLDSFKGPVIHSSEYENVRVVGARNLGIEIANDLCNWGAQTSIVVRNHVHMLSKEIVQLGMYLLKYISCTSGDNIVLMLSNLWYGNLHKYGLQRPTKEPSFFLKESQFDAIVLATGFRSTVQNWLKDDGRLFNENGMPKHRSPNHWKGEDGIYCVGFASAGLFGISNDAKNIANDIFQIVSEN